MRKKNNIRNSFALSQQEEADYLQVSRSLLNMYESGKRSLPTHAYIKLARLEIARQQVTETNLQLLPSPDPATCRQLLAAHLSACHQKLYVLQQQHKALESKLARLQARQQTLELMRTCSLPDCDTREEKWVAYQSFLNTHKLSCVEPGQLFMLQHKINMLLAEIAATEVLMKTPESPL